MISLVKLNHKMPNKVNSRRLATAVLVIKPAAFFQVQWVYQQQCYQTASW